MPRNKDLLKSLLTEIFNDGINIRGMGLESRANKLASAFLPVVKIKTKGSKAMLSKPSCGISIEAFIHIARQTVYHDKERLSGFSTQLSVDMVFFRDSDFKLFFHYIHSAYHSRIALVGLDAPRAR